MKDFAMMQYHPDSESLVKIICNRTENTNPLFFRIHVAWYWSQLASMMRCSIDTLDRNEIPINMYAVNLMTSGAGKGLASNFMEDNVVKKFYSNFKNITMPALANKNLAELSLQRAAQNTTSPEQELSLIQYEYEQECGPYLTSFDSGTPAAVKQARNKLLLANVGSLNLCMDEIGSHLAQNIEILDTLLELYDVGKVKAKLVKHTSDNRRHQEIPGRTPANFLGFGTPASLLNGGKIEEDFYALIERGLGRRSLFGYSRTHEKKFNQTAQEIFDAAKNGQVNQFVIDLANRLKSQSDVSNAHRLLSMPENTTLLFIEYRLDCQRRSEELADHDVMRKAELDHRYFKATKLAGAYAFIDGATEITEEYFDYAVKLVEDSGHSFNKILTRDRKHVKLAKYLGSADQPVTQSDLVEDLPYYRGSASSKQELMQLAISWGYQNNISIKRKFEEGIEFVEGEVLQPTDLTKCVLSHSYDLADGYVNEIAQFNRLHELTSLPGRHWCNHHFVNSRRKEDHAIKGFNLLVLDVENSVSLTVAKSVLKDYLALFYTTKRHTDQENRYRIVIPTNYKLELDAPDYKEFMQNVFKWLPFNVDDGTGQRCKKWLSNQVIDPQGEIVENWEYQNINNSGKMLDVLPFIPKTTKNDDFLKVQVTHSGMDNLERWYLANAGDGNRNNMLLRYAMVLVDSNYDYENCLIKIMDLNSKLDKPLSEGEVHKTIMRSVASKVGLPKITSTN